MLSLKIIYDIKNTNNRITESLKYDESDINVYPVNGIRKTTRKLIY